MNLYNVEKLNILADGMKALYNASCETLPSNIEYLWNTNHSWKNT